MKLLTVLLAVVLLTGCFGSQETTSAEENLTGRGNYTPPETGPEQNETWEELGALNISAEGIAKSAADLWMIFEKKLEVIDGVTYVVVTGVSMSIEKGAVVHTKKDVWIRVDDGKVLKVDVLGPANSSSDCLTMCRYECNLYDRQPCIDSCHSGMTSACTSNGSRYCSGYCTGVTYGECGPLCAQQVGNDCNISCSAGNPAPSVKEKCIKDCTYLQEYRCNSECMSDRRVRCESDCLALYIVNCTTVANRECAPKCDAVKAYSDCLADCNETCIPKEWEVSNCTAFPSSLQAISTTYDEYCPVNVLGKIIDTALGASTTCYWGRGGSEDMGKIYCNSFGIEYLPGAMKNHSYNLIYSCNETRAYQMLCSQFYGSSVVCNVGGTEYMVNVSDFTYNLVSSECYHSLPYT